MTRVDDCTGRQNARLVERATTAAGSAPSCPLDRPPHLFPAATGICGFDANFDQPLDQEEKGARSPLSPYRQSAGAVLRLPVRPYHHDGIHPWLFATTAGSMAGEPPCGDEKGRVIHDNRESWLNDVRLLMERRT
jgi:hypothetical protein